MPKEDLESWTEYLYKLSLLDLEEQKKQYKKMVKSTLGALHFSQNYGDTIARTFSMRDSSSQTLQKIKNFHILYQSKVKLSVFKNHLSLTWLSSIT